MNNDKHFASEGKYIIGDTDSGICTETWTDQLYSFTINCKDVRVEQSSQISAEGLISLDFRFELEEPARFSVEVMIPLDAENACVTLNNQVLIMPVSDDWPDELKPLSLSDCQLKGTAVSTIRLGEFQKINFKWQNGDVLSFYCIMPKK